jgi:hypothetical protein
MTEAQEDLLVKYFTNKLTTLEEYRALDDLCGGDPTRAEDLYCQLPDERSREILSFWEISEDEIQRQTNDMLRAAAYQTDCPSCRKRILEHIGEIEVSHDLMGTAQQPIHRVFAPRFESSGRHGSRASTTSKESWRSASSIRTLRSMLPG